MVVGGRGGERDTTAGASLCLSPSKFLDGEENVKIQVKRDLGKESGTGF